MGEKQVCVRLRKGHEKPLRFMEDLAQGSSYDYCCGRGQLSASVAKASVILLRSAVSHFLSFSLSLQGHNE